MPSDPNELPKFVRDFQVGELNYWRNHRWSIFSWAAGLLLGGTGALFIFGQTIVAPASQHSWSQRVFLIMTVMSFVAIAMSWMFGAHGHENDASKVINKIDAMLGIPECIGGDYKALPMHRIRHIGSIAALLILGVFAIFAIFLAP
jgi:predicted membrane channel-forming protein YqfA (hemolysin III family)